MKEILYLISGMIINFIISLPFILSGKSILIFLSIFSIILGWIPAAILMLVYNGFNIIINYLVGNFDKVVPGVSPVIPGVKVGKYEVPWVGWFGLLIGLIFHELFHGIMMVKNKIKIESGGILLLLFIPIGGFVKPDEKQFLESDDKTIIETCLAGPTANLVLTIIFLLLLFVIDFSSIFLNFGDSQIQIVAVEKNYPASAYLKPGDIIKKIDNKEIKTIQDLKDALKDKNECDITILRDNNQITYRIVLKDGRIGVQLIEYSETFSFIHSIIYWAFMLNFAIFMGNLIPIPIFDGGHIIDRMLKNSKILIGIWVFLFLVLFINFIPNFI